MNRINPKRLGRAGSLDTPSIVRRQPKLAREIRARRLHTAAPARNQWGGAVWKINSIIKTAFAIIGALVFLTLGIVIFKGF
jgi:hypothetical protein